MICKPLKSVPATPTGQTHLVNDIVFSIRESMENIACLR